MEYNIPDIQSDTLTVQRQLTASLGSVHRSVQDSDEAVRQGIDAMANLETAIQDVSGYVQKSGEALAAGRNLATHTRIALDSIATATLGQDISAPTEHAANCNQYSAYADQKRNEALDHGLEAIHSLNLVANGLAKVITHTSKSVDHAEKSQMLLGFGKDTLNENIVTTNGTDNNVTGMKQKLETATEKSKQYVLGLHTAKDQLRGATPSTHAEDDYFDATRHDVGDIEFLVERIVTGVGRLRESKHKRVGTFNQLLELVHTKVTEKDVQELHDLLGRLNKTIETLRGTSMEQEDLPLLLQGALSDNEVFRQSL